MYFAFGLLIIFTAFSVLAGETVIAKTSDSGQQQKTKSSLASDLDTRTDNAKSKTTDQNTVVTADTQTLLKNANYLFDHKNFKRAVSNCDRIIKGSSKPNAHAYEIRGRANRELGKIPEALADLQTAIKLKVANQATYYALAQVHVEMQKLDLAVQDLTEAIKFVPNGGYIYRARGELYMEKAQYAKALDDFKTAVKLNPGSVDNHRSLGHLFMRTHQYDKAAAEFSKAISLQPNDPRIYSERGSAFQKAGKMGLAKRDFGRANQSGFWEMSEPGTLP